MESEIYDRESFMELFKLIAQSDKISRINKNVIVLTGLTRAGKSTTYNMKIDPSVIVGKRLSFEYYYALKDEKLNPETAIVDKGF
jgi:hypothetical protein